METTLSVRLDPQLKADAERTLDELGLSLSSAVRVFLTQAVLQQQLPFPVQIEVPAGESGADASPEIQSRDPARADEHGRMEAAETSPAKRAEFAKVRKALLTKRFEFDHHDAAQVGGSARSCASSARTLWRLRRLRRPPRPRTPDRCSRREQRLAVGTDRRPDPRSGLPIQRSRRALPGGASSAKAPRVVIVGGQPGAGKTAGILDARRQLNATGEGAAFINGDELRPYPPRYEQLVARDNATAADKTGTDVDDKHGHAVGHRVLKVFCKRLRNLVRPHDTVSRLDGDEFAIILKDPKARATLGRWPTR